MKAIRLHRGHRLSLTDGEFEALRRLVELGINDIESAVGVDLTEGMSLAGRRGLNSIMRHRLAEVDDRRKEG